MSTTALSWAFRQPVNATEKLVLIALCDHASDEGVCWVAMRTMMSKTSLSERAIQQACKRLEAGGYLRRSARFQGARQTSNLWEVVFAAPAENAAPARPAAPAPDAPPPAPDAGAPAPDAPPPPHDVRPLNLQQEPSQEPEQEPTPQPPKGGKEVKRKKASEDDHDHLIPLQLQTPEFIASWHIWAGVRIKMRQALTEEAAKRQLHRLATEAGTPDEAIRWLDVAIERGWRAPYNPGGSAPRRLGPPPTRRAGDDEYSRANSGLNF